jgi:hypothetical protein
LVLASAQTSAYRASGSLSEHRHHHDHHVAIWLL